MNPIPGIVFDLTLPTDEIGQRRAMDAMHEHGEALVRAAQALGITQGCRIRDDTRNLNFRWRPL